VLWPDLRSCVVLATQTYAGYIALSLGFLD
jgi:hypothetical protein